MKTESELLFEQFCEAANIPFTPINTADRRTPDYAIVIGNVKVLVEVKELTPNDDEHEIAEKYKRTHGACWSSRDSERVRSKIEDAKDQLKQSLVDRVPSVLLLYNNRPVPFQEPTLGIAPYAILSAMYGYESIDIHMPKESGEKVVFGKHRFGKGKKLRHDCNTHISAVGVLFKGLSDGRLHLVFYENIHAQHPLPYAQMISRTDMTCYTLPPGPGNEHRWWAKYVENIPMKDECVGPFTDIDSAMREKIWAFLNDPGIMQLMIDASEAGRPAAGAVGQALADHLKEAVASDRVKRFIGRLIRRVMESRGYHLSGGPRRAQLNPLFKNGSTYSRDGQRIMPACARSAKPKPAAAALPLPPEGIVRHVMPGDPDAGEADISWFSRQNPFEQEELRRLVAYKRDILGITEDGFSSKHPNYTYPHILPAESLNQAFYSPMADPIIQYLAKENIQQHTESLNLKSSQAACLNLLFPLRQNLRLATEVLRPFLEGLEEVTGIEFEYTGQDEAKGDRGCTEWLGEPPNGKRGQHRTSIDAAIFWKDVHGRRCATLIEWKYTERSFGDCSAFYNGNAAYKARCLGNNGKDCQLEDGGPYRSRLYWSRLEQAGIDVGRLSQIAGCPFRGPFYQLMRQYLVARYILVAKTVDHTEVVAIHFSRNEALKAVSSELRPLGGKDVLEAWNSVLKGVPPMRAIEAERLMKAYDGAAGVDAGWRGYVRQRYRI